MVCRGEQEVTLWREELRDTAVQTQLIPGLTQTDRHRAADGDVMFVRIYV